MTQLSDYQILRPIDEGGFGKVYLALAPDGKLMCVKSIPLPRTKLDIQLTAVEASIHSRLRSDHIIQCYSSFSDAENFYLVLEYAEHGSLLNEIKKRKGNSSFTEREICDFLEQITQGLIDLHNHAIVHGDLKPANILICADNTLKLADFGLSHSDPSLSFSLFPVGGTPYYMAPESFSSKYVSSAADVWALGVIAYQLCTFSLPFEGSDMTTLQSNIINKEVPTIPLITANSFGYSPSLRDLVSQMLMKDPNERITLPDLRSQLMRLHDMTSNRIDSSLVPTSTIFESHESHNPAPTSSTDTTIDYSATVPSEDETASRSLTSLLDNSSSQTTQVSSLRDITPEDNPAPGNSALSASLPTAAEVQPNTVSPETVFTTSNSSSLHPPSQSQFEATRMKSTNVQTYLDQASLSVSRKTDSVHERNLRTAALNGSVDTIEHLLEMQCNIDAPDKFGVTPLHYAAYSGQVDAVKCLINYGADVNKQDNAGWSALHIAAQQGSLPVVQCIIENGGDINLENEYGLNALHSAVHFGHLDILAYLFDNGAFVTGVEEASLLVDAADTGHLSIVQYLVEQGWNVNGTVFTQTPLISAAFHGHLPIVQYLLQHGSDINAREEDGYTPLSSATQTGCFDVVVELVNNGCDVNLPDNDGTTPLMMAIVCGHLDILEYLCDHGADVTFRRHDGFNAICFAAQVGNLRMMEILVSKGATLDPDTSGKDPLFVASSRGHLDIVEYLLLHGCDVNRTLSLNFINGTTSLMCASAAGHLSVVDCLIQHGADVNLQNGIGETALMDASIYGNLDIVQCLIDNGADPNLTSFEGTTALHAAIVGGGINLLDSALKQGNDIDLFKLVNESNPFDPDWVQGKKKIVEYLLTHGSNVNARDTDGQTPLCLAVSLNQKSLVNLLIQYDADVNQADLTGCSPLFLAYTNGFADVFELLVSNGADTAVLEKAGIGDMHISGFTGNLETLEALIQSGGDINTVDPAGCTILFRAIQAGQNEVAKWLMEQGADVDLADKDGWTPLHVAAFTGNEEITIELITHAASLNVRITSGAKEGMTALHIALDAKKPSVAELLINVGVDPTLTDKNGNTPYTVAKKNKLSAIIHLLEMNGVPPN